MARRPDIARRTELASRAFEIIRARGVHRTTMSDIAAGLEIKRPTLYWYFRDLGEIFDAVIEDAQARFMAFLHGRLVDVVHPIDYLETLARATVAFYEGRRDLIVLLFQLWAVGGSEDPERILARGRALMAPLRAGLVARVEEGVRRGQVAACDAGAVVDLTLAVTDGALMQWIARDQPVAPILAEMTRRVLDPLRLLPRKKPRRSR
jgi:TetR/AcrR family transcriptional regulator, acrAB operon repressor